MIRMMLLGYCYSIRSDRRLCQEVDMSFAYRWFCGLGLECRVPDPRRNLFFGNTFKWSR